MRILIINQPFWPDVVATAQHMADWAEYLAAQGHTVTVIASRSVYGKQGAVLPKSETYKGILIHRVGSNLFSKGRILTRLVDFGLFHVRALTRALTLPRQDVVVCLTTPPMVGMVGRLLKLFRGTKYVQYEMDLYPDVAVALGVMKPTGIAARLFDRIHRYLLRKADRTVVLGRCMRRVIEAKGVPPEKMVLVTPWADPEEIQATGRAPGENAFRGQHGLDGKFVVLYAGNFGMGHDIETLAGAMERLRDDEGVQFVFVGGGRRMKEIESIVETRSIPRVLFLDYVPREELPEMIAAGDLHVITQAPRTSGLIVPSKFYGILAAGRPSLYIGPEDTEVAYTIAEEGVGTVLKIGDVEGVVGAIQKARGGSGEDMAAKARHVLNRGHSRQACVQALTRMAESLLTH